MLYGSGDISLLVHRSGLTDGGQFAQSVESEHAHCDDGCQVHALGTAEGAASEDSRVVVPSAGNQDKRGEQVDEAQGEAELVGNGPADSLGDAFVIPVDVRTSGKVAVVFRVDEQVIFDICGVGSINPGYVVN